MKKYEGDKTALCAYFHFRLGIPIPNANICNTLIINNKKITAKKNLLFFLQKENKYINLQPQVKNASLAQLVRAPDC